MKPSGIGGQAVIEGVMMKNGSKCAVAVRKPNNEIVVEKKTIAERKSKFLSIPVIRGVVAFVDSLSLGMNSLTFSASFYEEEEQESKFEKKLNEITKGHADGILNGVTMVLAVLLAVGIFVVAPMFLAGFLAAKIENTTVLAVLEGVFRLLIFVLYIVLISQVKDIKRLFIGIVPPQDAIVLHGIAENRTYKALVFLVEHIHTGLFSRSNEHLSA